MSDSAAWLLAELTHLLAGGEHEAIDWTPEARL